MTTLIPTANQLVIKLLEEEENEGQSIIVPDAAKKGKNLGKVVALSSQLKDGAELKCGHKVIYRVHAATEIEADGEKYLVLPYEGILVIVVE